MPAATARRCLLTLEELGYVTRNGRDFLLRPKVLELGAAYLESMNIEQLTKTHLEELARSTADSAALCVLDGTEIVYVARTSVRTLVRLEAHVGSRFPAHATSTGRVLLAGLSPDRLQQLLRADQTRGADRSYGDRPGPTAAAHRGLPPQRLFRGRRTSWPTESWRWRCRVFDQRGRVVAALNTSSHSRRITKTRLVRDRLSMLQDVSRQISADLAGIPGLSLSAQL